MPLDREEVEHIAALARIGLTEEELEAFRNQLSQILELFQGLGEVDTDGVPPTGHAIEIHTVLRDDGVANSLEPEEVLFNAPRREGNMFRVRAVLEE